LVVKQTSHQPPIRTNRTSQIDQYSGILQEYFSPLFIPSDFAIISLVPRPIQKFYAGRNSWQINIFSKTSKIRNPPMTLPPFVTGLLLGTIVPAFKDAATRFLIKQLEVQQRRLAELGVNVIVCKPEERLALLAIGAEMDHQTKAVFKINSWSTYRRWVK
jgi:hypothetical protein